MKRSPNRPRRREPYHYDATGAQYIRLHRNGPAAWPEHPAARLAGSLPYAAALYAQLNHRPRPGGVDFERAQ